MNRAIILMFLLSLPAYGQLQVGSGGSVSIGSSVPDPLNTVAIQDKGGQVYNVKAYGAKGDGVFLYACSATSGNTTVTCTDGAFAAGDIGKAIEVDNAAGSAPDITTIASVTDATHVVVTVAPAFTLATTNVVYGTDDTTAIQNEINAVFNAGGGAVFFPKGVYILNGPMASGPNLDNGILYIPQIDTSAVTANPFPALTLMGPSTPSAETLEAPFATFKPTASSAVLYGMTYNGGTGNIIAGPPSTPFDSCTVVIRNISFRTRANPDIGAVNLYYIKNAQVQNVSVGINISSSINVPQPTNVNASGVVMPTLSSSGVKDVNGLWVYGFYTGLTINEHANVRNYEGHQLVLGLKIESNATHAVFLSNVDLEGVITVLSIGGPTPVFGTVDTEHETSGWYQTTTDISVSSTVTSQPQGYLFMTVYHPGTGYVAPTLNFMTRYLSVWAFGIGQVAGLNYDAPFTFAQISVLTVINGARVYCSDCKSVTDGAAFDSIIASAGTGTPVVGENGQWRVH